VIELAKLDPAGLDSRLGPIDASGCRTRRPWWSTSSIRSGRRRTTSCAEIAVAHETLRGVYVLGKAATLNADVGDVLISGVIHDEHSGTTYWLDKTRSRSMTSRRTWCSAPGSTTSARSRSSRRSCRTASTSTSTTARLHGWWRWRRAPFCNAVYEIADADRYPQGEAVNFGKLPIDLGSSTTRLTRPTRRRGPWARAGCRTTASTRRNAVVGGDHAADPRA